MLRSRRPTGFPALPGILVFSQSYSSNQRTASSANSITYSLHRTRDYTPLMTRIDYSIQPLAVVLVLISPSGEKSTLRTKKHEGMTKISRSISLAAPPLCAANLSFSASLMVFSTPVSLPKAMQSKIFLFRCEGYRLTGRL